MKNSTKVTAAFLSMALISAIIAWFVAGNLQQIQSPELNEIQLSEMLKNDRPVIFLDVRAASKLPQGHTSIVDSALQIPLEQLPNAMDALELSHDNAVIVYDTIFKRSVVAAKILRNAGHDAFALRGGIETLRKIFEKDLQ